MMVQTRYANEDQSFSPAGKLKTGRGRLFPGNGGREQSWKGHGNSNTEIRESFACHLPLSHNTESTRSHGRQSPNRKVEVMNLIAHENQDSNGNVFFGKRDGGRSRPSAVALLRRASRHPGHALREAAFRLQSEDGEQAFLMNFVLGDSWGAEDRPAIDPRWSEARLAATFDD